MGPEVSVDFEAYPESDHEYCHDHQEKNGCNKTFILEKSIDTDEKSYHEKCDPILDNSSDQSLIDERVLMRRSSLDNLLHLIYRSRRRFSSIYEHTYCSDHSITLGELNKKPIRKGDQKETRKKLIQGSIHDLELMRCGLTQLMTSLSNELLKELKKRDRLNQRRFKHYDVITATFHAMSRKTTQDTRMRFSVEPFACDSGFAQWHDAMKMCARLPGGIPQEFRRRMWLTLAEQHVRQQQINWKEVERNCFNEWSTPDDVGLGDQIVKDLHRTGCTLFCGANAEDNQALLKRVLLGYARWNKTVGYCQGFNMLAAIILQVMDRQESDALKVMIYLIEGVLPESYFANNLRGLAVDMAVFRDLMRAHLPVLSCHLECLQKEASDLATGACYEPPLTNVFTMQWFLTLFSNCLPRDAVMRVWDLTFLQGNEMLLRTALAIWGKISSRILEVQTADEFYTVMGVLTQQILVQGLMDTNQLVQTLVGMAPFPFPGLISLRDKYTYNITPWTHSVSSVAKKGLRIFYLDDEDDDRGDNDEGQQEMAVAAAFGLSNFFKKGSNSTPPTCGRYSPIQGQIRPNLDISSLKKQYEKLRERQKQAHIILTTSHQHRNKAKDSKRGGSKGKSSPLAMKHLLRGKKALASKTKRVVPQGMIPTLISKKKVERKLSDSTGIKQKTHKGNESKGHLVKEEKSKAKIQTKCVEKEHRAPPPLLTPEPVITNDETLHWKDAPPMPRRASLPYGVKLMENFSTCNLPDIKDDVSERSSTSTELCDDEDGRNFSDEDNSENVRSTPSYRRLESFCGEKDAKSDKLYYDVNLKHTPEIENFDGIKSNNQIDDNYCVKHNKSNDIKLNIPIIPKAKIEQISLSSPTKWKWSFSEVKDPFVSKPISPIITLHNFASQEQEQLNDIPSSPQNCPTILLNNQNPNYIDSSSFIQYDKNNMFSYLFEITDISKLSNNNSANPSPSEEDKVRYFDTEKLGKSLNSRPETEEKNEVGTLICNNCIEHPINSFVAKDYKENNSKHDSPLRSRLHKNEINLFPENITHQVTNVPVENDNDTSRETYHATSSKLDSRNINDGNDISFDCLNRSQKEACNVSNVPQICDIKNVIENSTAKVVAVNNVINSLDTTITCQRVNGHVNIKNNENILNSEREKFGIENKNISHNSFDKIFSEISEMHIENDSNREENIASQAKIERAKELHITNNVLQNSSKLTCILSENNSPTTVSELLLLRNDARQPSENDSAVINHEICKEQSTTEIREISSESKVAHAKYQQSSSVNDNKAKIKGNYETFLDKEKVSHLTSEIVHLAEVSNKGENDCSNETLPKNKDIIDNTTHAENLENNKHSSYFGQIFKDVQSDQDISTSASALCLPLQKKDIEAERHEEFSSEVIRRRLWAGVKCLSLDAATIYENMKEKALESQFPSLPTLDESPNEILHTSTPHIKHPVRRNSEAALKLMTENTKMLDKFTRHMSEIEETNLNFKDRFTEIEKEETKYYMDPYGNFLQLLDKSATSESEENYTLVKEETLPGEIYVQESNIDNNTCSNTLYDNLCSPSIENTSVETSKVNSIQSEIREINGSAANCVEPTLTEYKYLPKYNTNTVPFSKKSFLRPKIATDSLIFQTVECQISDPYSEKTQPNYERKQLTCDPFITKESNSKSISSPFPLRPIDRPPKEAGVQLGLYNPKTKATNFH